MPLNRRQLLKIIAAGAASSLLTSPILSQASVRPKIKAIAFDAFPIFDPRPIFGLTKKLFPEQGEVLGKLWFTKIFGYTWLRTSGEQYKNFYAVIDDALLFSAKKLKLDLTSEKHEQLINVWLALKIWPDVKPALQYLKEKNIRLGFLSNMTEEMLRTNAKNSGIEEMFEFYLSTDKAQAFKPDPRAYQLGVDAFGLPKENIAFTAFAGWDASGASWFGYPTIWVNRLNLVEENLGVSPHFTGKGMKNLLKFIERQT
ncbi:Haloacid dehalogenase, type II [hydrothermal vent metagenome]|uniref:Haloacid dehalogenase, type II n=1 Tax=hydrothermal vent metagenome TaxID=652676 RepID=A0A3B0WBQ8_9ZZZZ